jgi:LytS/YehU family sensor histidine kinase
MLDYDVTDNEEAKELAYEFWSLTHKESDDELQETIDLMKAIEHYNNYKKILISKERYEDVIVINEVIKIFTNQLYEA